MMQNEENVMMKRILTLICLSIVIAMVMSGCGAAVATTTAATTKAAGATNAASTTAAATAQAKKLRFAYLVKNLTNPYFIDQANGVKETCAKYGIEVTVQATEKETDIDKQIQIADNYLTQKFDAIIVAPLSSTAIVPLMKRANDAGVPFINIDTPADAKEMEKLGAKRVTYVGADNYTAGEAAATGLIEALGGKGKIAVLEGTSGAESAESRKKGFNDKIKGTGLQIVASQPANYNRNMGYTVFQSILAANPDIVGLFAANDEMALGAVKAIDEAGLTGKIKIVGINFVKDAQDAIKAGKMYGSITQQPYEMGRLSVEKAIDFINKKAVDPQYITESKLMKVSDVK